MSVLPVGFGSSGSYQITNSLRLRASASAYLSRTPGVPGTSRRVGTISFLIKRGALTSDQRIYSADAAGANDGVRLTAGDQLEFRLNDGANGSLVTSAVYRDPTAHMHVVVGYDTTQATASDRCSITINGVVVTSFSTATYPTLNYDTYIGHSVAQYISRLASSSSMFVDGTVSDFYYVDGQKLSATNFGQFDINGVWVPKPYAGTYGTNGFHLDFKDAALTSGSNAGLGKDVSGNGNYWTTNNISVTAGVTYDALVDTPTNNYCVLSGVDKGPDGVLSAAALNLYSTSAWASARGTMAIPLTGSWCWEFTYGNSGTDANMVGIAKASVSAGNMNEYFGGDVNGYAYSYNPLKWNSSSAAYGTVWATGDVIGVKYDADAGTLTFYNNGTTQGAAFSGLSGEFFPALAGATTSTGQINFGQRPFAYSYGAAKALCTANLPAVAIPKPANYFNVKTRTGTGTAFNVTGELFQPALVWTKGRSGATDHAVYDAVRGTTKDIGTNLATDETIQAQGVTAFNSDGFSGGTLAKLNTNSATYIDLMWAESALAGLDIVAVTGNGANRTVAHNLGAVPKMIIGKSLTTAGADTGWPVYHASLANTEYLMLNTTAGKATGATYWNSTTPTSGVFSLGTAADVNTNADSYIYYCFAEVPGYSKFGSYVGNGSADGPFVYCGFRPRWIMWKASSTTGHWRIYDVARDTFNVMGAELYPNAAGAEAGSMAMMDVCASGFKFRSASDGVGSGQTAIFAAFAEHPFGGSNVAPAPAR